MTRSPAPRWAVVTLVCIGLFGIAFSLSSLFTALPANAEGTCGPGHGSESAFVAFFDPITIGAGAKPPATKAAALTGWNAFVNSCQSATNDRVMVAGPVLIVSLAIAIVGPMVLRRRSRRSPESGPSAEAPFAPAWAAQTPAWSAAAPGWPTPPMWPATPDARPTPPNDWTSPPSGSPPPSPPRSWA